jgi:ribulose-bisphosphate carboxylase large chain
MAWILARYLLASRDDEVQKRADALALEQSIEMPLEAVSDPLIRESIVARVSEIAPLDAHRYRVTLQLATATTGEDVTQLTNMLFGNCSLQDDVELENVEFPAELLSRFGGPRYGIAGLRALTGAARRPLTCTALKPQGSSPQTLAALCETFGRAGIDVIKDDHGIADQRYAPFAQRVTACHAAAERASAATGKPVIYAPSLVGSPRAIFENAKIARECGIRAVLLAPMLVGLGTFAEFVSEFEDFVVLAHPAFGGSRISPAWLFGKFFRLLGADATIYPNYGGRFAYTPDVCRALADSAREAWGPIRPAMPVPAGGMTVERVPEMIDFYGTDVMLLIGGSLLSAGEQLAERSRSFVRAVGGGV